MSLFGDVSNFFSGGKDDAATAAAMKAAEAFDGLEIPDAEKQKLFLEHLQQQGVLTPEMEQAISMGASAFNSVYSDPRLKQAQMDALSSLSEIGTQGGMNMEDRSRLAQVQSESARQEGAQRAAIMQSMAQRGMGGSGFDLAAQLTNQQGSADRAAQAGLDVNAQAQKRALEAMMQAGTLGGQIQAQDFSQQAQKAQANDAISQFNAQNSQSVQGRNVASQNAAQASNLAEKQRVADQNVSTNNQQQQYNKQLLQQQYENELKKAQGRAGGYAAQANTLNQQGTATKGMVGGLISAGATAGAAASDRRAKTDIKPMSDDDVTALLNELSPYKYNYKNPAKYGAGTMRGVMAQDVEKVAPEAVHEEDGVKVVDYDDPKIRGAQLAALANLHERLKKLEA